MGKKPSHDTVRVPATPSEPSSLALLADMADTTWRMFAPTIPLIILGDWLDGKYNTRPWLLLLGAIVGGLIAALLIKQLLRRNK